MFRASSRGSRRSQEPLDHYRENSINVYLQDVQHLVRRGIVGLPGPGQISLSELDTEIFAGGFTKSGNPLLILPDKAGFSNVTEGDLHLLLKYFISVVPKAEQVCKKESPEATFC